MRPLLHGQVFASSEVDYLHLERIFRYHNVVRLQVSVHYAKHIVHVLQAQQELPHDWEDLLLFIKFDEALSPLLFDVLRETHVHALEDEVKPSVVILYPLRLHHERAVSSLILVETLEYLYFSLFECLFFGLVFVLMFRVFMIVYFGIVIDNVFDLIKVLGFQ